MPDPALLERDAELATLAELVDRLAGAGEGGAALIEGVAGIGKSSLLRAVTDGLSSRADVRLLQARGSELEFELAFGGVRQLLAAAVFELGRTERDAILSGPGKPAGAVLGAHEPPAGPVDPLYSLFWLVATLAESAPLVLAIDDVHWLDPESARLVAYLARRVEGLPVLLLATARYGDPGASSLAMDALRASGPVLVPHPLSAEASAILADDPDAHRLTGGNPLLLHEFARSPDAGKGLASAVSQRVARISDGAVALANAVALFGAGTTLMDAAVVAGLELAVAGTAADALVAAQILTASDDGRLEYVHPLLRSATYDQLAPFARRAGHARAAAALRARGAPVEQIAAHLLAGEPAGDPESVRVLRAAADSAVASMAPRAAIRYLERALAEGAGGPMETQRLLVDMGVLQRRTGDPEAQRTLARAFAQRELVPHDPRVAIELALTAFVNVDHRTVTDVVTAMRGADLGPDDRLTLDMLMAESAWNADDVATCMALIDRVPAGLPGDTPAQRLALSMVGAARLFRCEPLDVVVDTLRRAVGPSGTANLVGGVDVGDPLGWLIFCDALDDAQAFAERRLEAARDSGDEALFAWTQGALGWIELMRGDLPASEATFRLGLMQPVLSPLMQTTLISNYVETLIMRGAFDEATATLDDSETTGATRRESFVNDRRAELAVWRGDYETALPIFEQRLAAHRAAGMRHPNLLLWTSDYAQALAGLGRRDEAVAFTRELVELSATTGGVSGAGTHQLTLGRLTGDIAELERAVGILEPSPFRWLAARAQLELGAALRRDRQRVEARDHLRLALDYAERNRVVHFSERARDELRLAGARPRKLVLTGADSLTPGELRIARLAAEGRSNKEIALHLFLTVKTVEATLVRTFRKLDISSRRELPKVLATPGA